MMGMEVPFGLALPVQPTGPKIRDLKVEAVAAITCECAAAPTFITRLTDPGICPACRRRYPIDRLQVQPTGPGRFEIHVNISTQVPVAPKADC